MNFIDHEEERLWCECFGIADRLTDPICESMCDLLYFVRWRGGAA